MQNTACSQNMLLPPINYEYYYYSIIFFQLEFMFDFKEFTSHNILGNFILLNLLTLSFKLQNWRKGPLWLTKLSSPHNN